jgi:hypothetical protein
MVSMSVIISSEPQSSSFTAVYYPTVVEFFFSVQSQVFICNIGHLGVILQRWTSTRPDRGLTEISQIHSRRTEIFIFNYLNNTNFNNKSD